MGRSIYVRSEARFIIIYALPLLDLLVCYIHVKHSARSPPKVNAYNQSDVISDFSFCQLFYVLNMLLLARSPPPPPPPLLSLLPWTHWSPVSRVELRWLMKHGDTEQSYYYDRRFLAACERPNLDSQKRWHICCLWGGHCPIQTHLCQSHYPLLMRCSAVFMINSTYATAGCECRYSCIRVTLMSKPHTHSPANVSHRSIYCRVTCTWKRS